MNHRKQGLKRFLRIWLAMLPLMLFQRAEATVLGGNITWENIGGDQYEISLRIYFDCYGLTNFPGDYPSTLDVIFNSGCAAPSFSSPASNPVMEEISQLCPSELVNSSCNNNQSPTPGVRQLTYTTTVTLASGCVWTVQWNEFNWNLQYMNMTPVFNQRALLQTIIDTSLPGIADAPEIVSSAAEPAVRYFCMGESYTETFNFNPATGTSLNLSLASAPLTYNTSTGVVGPVAGYSQPTGLTFVDNNDETATLTWTAPSATFGYYIVPIEVEVLQGATVIGTIIQTVTIVVRNCNPIPTTFEEPPVTSTGPLTTYINNAVSNDQLEVCAGDSLIFTVQASNFDAVLTAYTTRTIDITYEFNPPAPGLSAITMTQVGTNPAVATFKLLTTGAMASTTPYVLEIQAEDDFCPIAGLDDITLEILINPTIRLLNNDTIVCANQPAALQATGLSSNVYQWSVVSGDTGPVFNGNATQNVTPDSTTVYQVTAAGIDPACNATEQVTVSVPLHRLALTINDESCGTPGSIAVNPLGANSSNITYSWSSAAGGAGIVPGIQNQSALEGADPPAQYTVIVTDVTNNCSITSPVMEIEEVTGPEFTLSYANPACEGSSVDVTMTFTAGQGPFDVWTTNVPNVGLTNANATDVPNPFVFPVTIASGGTTFDVRYVRDANGCVSAAGTVPVSPVISSRPLVTTSLSAESGGSALSAPIEICPDEPLQLVLDHSDNNNYSVVYSINGINQPAITVADGGFIDVPDPTTSGTFTYDVESVSYLNAPLCPSSDAANAVSVTVGVFDKPTAAIPAGPVSACAGNAAVVQVTLTGDAPWEFTYTLDGVAQAPITGINSSPYILTPTVGGTYCITSVTDSRCSNAVSGECINVSINPFPTVVSYTINSISSGVGQVDVCEGDNMSIEVTVSPAGNSISYVFADTPDFGFGTVDNQSSNYQQNFTPTGNFTLELEKVYFTTAPVCSTTVNLEIDINIRTEITLDQTNILCDALAENYEITYTLDDGVAPYSTTVGSDPGAFASNVFTTDPLPSGGNGGSWNFQDFYGCNILPVTDLGYTCPVISNAGVMNTNAQEICSGSNAPQATANQTTAYTLDGNDAFMFILHSNPGNILGSEIARSCGDPNFGDANSPLSFAAATGPNNVVSGTLYYISCVVGNNDGTGCVDESHFNTQFTTAPQPITWYESGSAALSASGPLDACAGETVDLSIDFTGDAPWVFTYTVNGLNPTTVTVNAGSPYTLSVNQSGTYALTALTNSDNNCTGTVSGSEAVAIHPAPAVTISGDAVICPGVQHCFDLAFTAGTAPFSAEINVPGVTANDALSNLVANAQYCNVLEGQYQVLQITDANGCSAAPGLSAAISVHPASEAIWGSQGADYCPNEPLITASFTTSGDGPFVIDLQGPDPANPPVVTNNTITIDQPGDYTIVNIEDANGCVTALNEIFTAVELPVPTADAGADVAECAGSLLTIGTPAQPGLTYSWSPNVAIEPGQSDDAEPSLTILDFSSSPYTYTLTVDNGSCSATDDVVISIFPNPFVNITATDNILCFDAPNNTSIITAVGQPNYDYVWDTSASIVGPANSSSITVDPTATETFVLTTSEDFGTVLCSTINEITIQVGLPLEIVNLVYPNEICDSTCIDGTEVEFDVLGEFGDFSALIDGEDTSFPICFDDPEQHQLVITDEEGCEVIADFTIEVRDQEYVMVETDQTFPFCFADDDGVVLGFNPLATNYILSQNGLNLDVIEEGPFVFQGLTIGAYDMTVNIQLSNGQVCSADTTFTIEADSPEIFIDVNPPAALGCLNQELSFEADLSGGLGNFSIIWSGCPEANACQIGVGAGVDVVLSQDTVIYVYGTDAVGCSSDTISAVGTLSSPPSLLVQNGLDTLETCQYECEDFTAFATGGTGALTVQWFELNDNAPFAETDTVNRCFLLNQTEAFEVRLLDEGCSTSLLIDTLWVVVHDTPEPIMDADEAGTCYPDTIQFTYALLDTNYTDLSTCVWSLGNGSFINFCGDTNVVYTSAGEFFPTLTITSEFGCSATDTLNNSIVIRGYPEVNFTWSPQPVDILNRQVQFQNLTQAADSIYWNFYSAGESFSANPLWTFPDIETTTPYEICLTAGNEFGCLDTLCQDVYVENILQVFIPNTFTPDGDGLNDVFLPVVNGELDGSYRFWVFNRWGEIVFYTEEVGKAWTGGFDGGTYYIQDGYYLWRVQVESLETGKLETYEGNVFILR